jgi:hypothetical protein
MENFIMSDAEKLNLQQMIKEQGVIDQTDNIRSLKHSTLIAQDILNIQLFLQKPENRELAKTNQDELQKIAAEKAEFIAANYTDIFRRICRDELDLRIFSQFLFVLKKIEDGNCDVHEGSYMIGRLLKEMYIDSATKKGGDVVTARNTEADATEAAIQAAKIQPKNISWARYKTSRLTASS